MTQSNPDTTGQYEVKFMVIKLDQAITAGELFVELNKLGYRLPTVEEIEAFRKTHSCVPVIDWSQSSEPWPSDFRPGDRLAWVRR